MRVMWRKRNGQQQEREQRPPPPGSEIEQNGSAGCGSCVDPWLHPTFTRQSDGWPKANGEGKRPLRYVTGIYRNDSARKPGGARLPDPEASGRRCNGGVKVSCGLPERVSDGLRASSYPGASRAIPADLLRRPLSGRRKRSLKRGRGAVRRFRNLRRTCCDSLSFPE